MTDVLSANELIRGIRQKSFEFREDLKMITASSPGGKSITFRPEQNDRWQISFEPSAGMERMDVFRFPGTAWYW